MFRQPILVTAAIIAAAALGILFLVLRGGCT